ncbi:MAG TPA: S8 family serine peptidase [Thermoanaerobaculia bacterium]|jgi:subtilisin family serine protease
MMRKLAVLAVLLLAMPLLAEEARQRYTIVTSPDVPRSHALRRLTSNAEEKIARRIRTFHNVSAYAADLTPAEAEELRQSPGVTSVDPVVERYAATLGPISANYENFDHQVTPWGLPVVHVQDVWPVTRGEGINVAVLDTGIDPNHPDLKAAYQGGVNILDETKPPMDDNFHGTHVSGIIAATDNDFGTVGAAPGVKLWSVKVLDREGKGYDEFTAAGLDWVVDQQRQFGGRWVVNMSLGSASLGGKLEGLAVQRAFEAGIVLVASAGNRNQDWLDYPAAYPGVLAVGAIGEDGEKAEFSSYGGGMPVVAPGVAVQSTFIEGYKEIGEVSIAAESTEARGLIGSPFGQLTAKIISCGRGELGQFPANITGNIALIQRGGELSFREKARNAKNAGASAVVIWNHDPKDPDAPLWTLTPKGCGPGENNCEPEWQGYEFPPTVGVANAKGLALVAKSGQTATVTYIQARYGRLSGTSMAAPHVAATAALLLSLDPTMNPTEIQFVIRHTARDTSTPGWDFYTSWGIVDALAAAKFVAPARFNLPPTQYTSPRRRSTRP